MEKRKYFESQEEGEEIICLVRKHWFTLFAPVIGTGFLYLLGLASIFILPRLDTHIATGFSYNIYVLVTSLVFLFSTAYIFAVLVLYYLNVILVTDKHLVEIKQERFFSRSISELELGRIQDVSSRESGFFQSLFNFGTVEVQTAGEDRNFIFSNIPRSSSYAQKIIQLGEEYRDSQSTMNKSGGQKQKSKLSKPKQNGIIEEDSVKPTIEQ